MQSSTVSWRRNAMNDAELERQEGDEFDDVGAIYMVNKALFFLLECSEAFAMCDKGRNVIKQIFRASGALEEQAPRTALAIINPVLSDAEWLIDAYIANL